MSIATPIHVPEQLIIEELAGETGLNSPKIVSIFAYDVAADTIVVDSAGRILVSASLGAWVETSFPALPAVT